MKLTFNLRTRKYYPHRKNNNELFFYIHKQSAHTPSITKRKFLPWSVKKYLIFHVKNSAPIKLHLTTTAQLNSHSNLLKEENTKATFYCLIHCLASTWRPTLPKYFCDSFRQALPKYHKYHKLFSRNNVKIS